MAEVFAFNEYARQRPQQGAQLSVTDKAIIKSALDLYRQGLLAPLITDPKALGLL